MQTPSLDALPAPFAASLARFHEAVRRTDALITADPTPHGKTPAEIRERAELRLDRLRRFLAQLGNPHQRYRIIHITGTSGKGSTSTAIASILSSAGLRTGLHTSPYLQTPTEKLQINGELIGPDAFADIVDEILAEHDAWVARHEAPLTYGEVWVALTLAWFAKATVDVAVIEVGAGGRFDLTNVVTPTVTAITSVGIDHTVTLGETIAEIAWHKAGIIKPGAPVVTAVTDPVALKPILAEAELARVPLTRVVHGETFDLISTGMSGTRWRTLNPDGTPEHQWPAPAGGFQAANAAVAVAVVREFARVTGDDVPDEAIERGLAAARIPGRYEVIHDAETGTRVILDGAHNTQKVAALAAEIARERERTDSPLVVVFGALEAKHYVEMAELLAPQAAAMVVTSPQVLAKAGAHIEALIAAVRRTGFSGVLLGEPEPKVAVQKALDIARDLPDALLLVSGSLYLVGNVRGRWYPDDAVTLARTPWPDPAKWPKQWFGAPWT